MNNTLSVAAVQLTSTSDWQENLLMAKSLIQAAAKEGARMVVLPENVFLFNGKAMRRLTESNEQSIIMSAVANIARECDIYLVIGSHPSIVRADDSVVDHGRVRQVSWIISPDGVFLGRYDKIHLFDAAVDDKAASYKESDFIEPGDVDFKVIDVDGFKVGMSICYDLRFPELYRELAALGADILLVPAAFTYVTGKAHWHTLLAARAIENQCFVLGVNQCGWHNETRQTYGNSALYSPWGESLASLGEEPGYFVFNLSKQAIEDCVRKMPCLSHRRL